MGRVSGDITVLRRLSVLLDGSWGELRATLPINTGTVLQRVGCMQSQALTRT